MKVSELFTYAVVISTQLATALPATSVDEGQNDQATSGVTEFAGALDAHGSSNGNSSSTPANGVGNVNDGDNNSPPPSATGVQSGTKDAGKDVQTSNDGEDIGASDDDALSKRGKGGKAQAAKKRGRGRGKKRGKRRVKKGTRTRARKGGKRGKKGTRTRAKKGGKRGKKGGKRRVRKGGKRGAARANAKNNKNNRKTQSNKHNHRRADLDQVDEQVRAVPDRFIKRQEQQLDSFQPFSGVEDFLQERGVDFVFVKRDGDAVADDTADDAAILFARQEGEDSGVFAAAAADDEEAAVFGRDEGSAEAEADGGAAFEAAEATDDVSAFEAAETTGDVSASEAAQATDNVTAFADGNEQQEEPAAAEASATTNDVAAAQEGGDGLDD